MTGFILALILLLIAGLANAAMDTLRDHYGISIFLSQNDQFWNAAKSWMNKYDVNYYNATGELRERFWGAKTIFVFITDGWHFMKFIFLSCMVMAIVCFQNIWWTMGSHFAPNYVYWLFNILICKLAFSIGFTIGYQWLWLKKATT